MAEMGDRDVTLRRTIQQAQHCVLEAYAVVVAKEDEQCAIDDLNQARLLIDNCLATLRARVKVRDL